MKHWVKKETIKVHNYDIEKEGTEIKKKIYRRKRMKDLERKKQWKITIVKKKE